MSEFAAGGPVLPDERFVFVEPDNRDDFIPAPPARDSVHILNRATRWWFGDRPESSGAPGE